MIEAAKHSIASGCEPKFILTDPARLPESGRCEAHASSRSRFFTLNLLSLRPQPFQKELGIVPHHPRSFLEIGRAFVIQVSAADLDFRGVLTESKRTM
jgi:hypothetical protein